MGHYLFDDYTNMSKLLELLHKAAEAKSLYLVCIYFSHSFVLRMLFNFLVIARKC